MDGVSFFGGEEQTISRYTFCDITPDSLRWDDAYSRDGGKTWTYDWIMEFSRTDANPNWPATSEAHTFEKTGSRCKGSENEFAMIDSIAGRWMGEVEVVEADSKTKAPAKVQAYKILDDCKPESYQVINRQLETR